MRGNARTVSAAVGVAAAGTAVGTAAAVAARRRRHRKESPEWLVVTVDRPTGEIMPKGTPPPPLDQWESVEVEVRPAPGDRGSELAVRWTNGDRARPLQGAVGRTPREELRAALRDAKSRLETGEVIEPDRPSTTHPTLPGKVFDAVTRRAAAGGVL